MRKLRIGHLAVYFGLFDEAMPDNFRTTREAFRSRVHDLLADHGDVVDPGLVDDAASAKAAGALFAREDVDVIVFAPTMAAPPGWAWDAVAAVDVPVIAVGAQESATVPADYDTAAATARSLPVGLVMFTNVLIRRGRPFAIVVGELSAPELEEQLSVALRAAAATSCVRRSPLLTVGAAIEGYDDVMADDADLAALGVHAVPVSRSELDAAFLAVHDERVIGLAAEMRRTTDATAVVDGVLHRSSRLALALDDLIEANGAVGGAVNCHGPLLRGNPGIGITACLGVSRCSTQGRPFACTGDVPTAIALVVGKVLTGSALYCELYQLDLVGDWILVANGGEGDLMSREADTRVRLLPEDHYAGECGAGTAVVFELGRGAATLISLSPVAEARGGWVLVVAEGEILDSRHPTMEGPNGMFRFASGSVAEAFGRWCAAGATHHAVVLREHRAAELQILADLLSIAVHRV